MPHTCQKAGNAGTLEEVAKFTADLTSTLIVADLSPNFAQAFQGLSS